MLKFDPDVAIPFLSNDLGAVLRHASTWSLVTGIDVFVAVVRMDAPGNDPGPIPSFVVELTIGGEPGNGIVELAGYLDRVLGDGMIVNLAGARCRVERARRTAGAKPKPPIRRDSLRAAV